MPAHLDTPCLWLDQVPAGPPRPRLTKDHVADVAIVGAGYTGLWTAYYLLRESPGLNVAVVERESAGFGASGRNGGWCSALFAASMDKITKKYGRDAAVAMQRAMIDTVDEVGRATTEAGIECDFHKGGTLAAATLPAHVDRIRAHVEESERWGNPGEVRWLDPEESQARLRLAQCYGSAFTQACARIHPAKLVSGLARVVEESGGVIFEGTEATAIGPGSVETPSATLRARSVIRATEGYTARLPGLRRKLVPLYSLMIATEPLPQRVWDEIGWDGRETLTDGRHLLIYGQRTADDRIAFGGRGAPYHLGSKTDPRFDLEPKVFEELGKVLISLFPALAGTRVTHRWGGPLGVPRDWFSAANYDRSTGLGWAGGYVGDGVATSNLAGRTLADLILDRDTDLTRLPWVGHRSRSWEPEPMRWIGINAALRTMATADAAEEKTGRPSSRGRLLHRLLGM